MESQDRSILEAFKASPSEETFRPLYDRTKDLVYTICYGVLRSEDDACDALQGVYGRLLSWVKDPGESGEEMDAPFLMRRLAWLEADRLRKRRSRRLNKEVAMDAVPLRADGAPSPSDVARSRELRERLQAIVGTLPDHYRVPVVLHYFHGMTHREIADMTGEPVATISSRIRRALKRMKPMARRAGLGDVALALAAVAAGKALLSPPSALGATAVYHAAEALAVNIAAGTAGSAASIASSAGSASMVGKAVVAAVFLGTVLLVTVPALRKPAPPPLSPTAGNASSMAGGPTTAPNLSSVEATGDRTGNGDKTAKAGPTDTGMNATTTASLLQPAAEEATTSATQIGVLVMGRVVAPDKTTPVPRAPVYLCVDDNCSQQPKVVTDEKGEFQFSTPPKEKIYLVSRTDQGTATKAITMSATEPRVKVELVLRAFASVSGRVLDPKGLPVPDCMVSLNQIERKSKDTQTKEGKEDCPCVDLLIAKLLAAGNVPKADTGIGVGRVKTDQKGFFTLLQVDPGTIRLNCDLPINSDFLTPDPLTLSIAPEENLDNVTIQLLESEYINGTVLAESGQPIAGATIQWYSTEGGQGNSRAAKTDAEGKYRLPGLRENQIVYLVKASHPSYQEATRNNLSAMDSPVNFTLKPKGGVTIQVVDPATGAPPQHFVYRLLQYTWNGFDYAPGMSGNRDGPPEGRIQYSDSLEQEMRVDVAEVTSSHEPTGRRGSAAFHFDPTAPPLTVVVPVLPSKTLNGKVVFGDEKQPVEGASVELTTLHSGTGYRAYGVDPLFDPKPATSDSAGNFTLTNLAPGTFTIEASKGTLKPDEPVSIEIPEKGEPQPVTIVLSRGATLFGKVTGGDGAPLANVTVNAMGYESFGDTAAGSHAVTDKTGRYRIEGLGAKRYRVVASPATYDLPERQEFAVLQPGEEHELNFDYSNTIHLTGQVTVNGRPWDRTTELRLLSVGGVEVYQLTPLGKGTYEVSVPAGQYDLAVLGRTNLRSWSRRFALVTWGPIADSVTLEDSPNEQEKNFQLVLGEADVYFDFPEDKTLPSGVLDLSERLSGRVRDHLDVAPVHGRSVHFLDLPPGDYKVTYQADDGTLRGESDWTAVSIGGENSLVVFLEGTRRERVGGWTPEMMSESFVTLTCDVSGAIDAPGDCDVNLTYEKGVHGVAIREVELLENGNVVARDDHPGWTGTANFNNVYHLTVPNFGAGSQYLLRAIVRSDGGTDSTGSVYLIQSK